MSERDELATRLLATFIGELTEQVRVLNEELLALERDPTATDHLHAVFRIAHTLKGAARAAAVPDVEHVCHEVERLLAAARDRGVQLGPESFTLLFEVADSLADAAERLARGEDLANAPIAPLSERLRHVELPAPRLRTPPADPVVRQPEAEQRTAESRDLPVRVAAAKLESLFAATAELTVSHAALRESAAEMREVQRLADEALAAFRHTGRVSRSGVTSLPAATEGEPVETVLRRLADLARRVATTRDQQGRALSLLSETIAAQVRELRMRPFVDITDPLRRSVRDLASSAGKDVELRVDGQEVEADRTVLDGIAEALLHLVRNAVDHGIETHAERLAHGKPAQATITVTAAMRGDRLLVRVTDDGAGIDIPALRKALAARGSVPARDEDVLRSMLSAGVTTRSTVSAISGRGVGLDIMHAAMARIRGRVDVESIRGVGTTFTLESPLTLATVRALLVRIGAQSFALPVSHVARVVRVRPEEVQRLEGRAVISNGAVPMPLLSLAAVLGPPLSAQPLAAVMPAVTLAAGTGTAAFLVDQLSSEQELLVRPLDLGDTPPPHVSAGAMLASGAVVLLLNPFTLVEEALAGAGEVDVAAHEAAAPAPASRRLLVVDDSITTRTLVQSILEAAGYAVLSAADGADAWRILQEHGVDLIVSDVEMPRMDGYALCRAVRASKRLQDVPVILVSALESQEHRQHGLEAGADAYIGKSSFDQQRLLELVERLIGGAHV